MENVKSSAARKYAEQDYEEIQLQKQVSSQFKSVWRKLLLESEESLLLELFLEEVQKEMGVRPDREQAARFIRSQAVDTTTPTASNAHNSAATRKERLSQHFSTSPTPQFQVW